MIVTKKSIFIILIIIVCITPSSFASSLKKQIPSDISNTKKYSISGSTMGTRYYVTVHSSKNVVTKNLKQKINVQLKIINNRMSLYLASSEISRFNKTHTNKPFKISKDFYKIMIQAGKLYNLTNGAWDGTIRPLYDLWSFSKSEIPAQTIPDKKKIELCLLKTGFKNIIIKDRHLIKIRPVTLDLGSIAKGYGVDAVVKLLKNQGFTNFFVEIGGEVYASGERRLSKKWRVGIAHPDTGFHSNSYKIVELSDRAVATSGTYRNFFKHKGKTYSHIINPKTGWPVDNNIVSVSVIADTCMLADGLATGLMAMGKQKAIALVNTLDNVECMIITKNKDKILENFFSKGFEKLLMRKRTIVY